MILGRFRFRSAILISGFCLLSLGSSMVFFVSRREAEPIADELVRVSSRLAERNFKSKEILDSLNEIKISNGTIPEATYLITRLVTAESTGEPQNRPHLGDTWAAYKSAASKGIQRKMTKWDERAGASETLRYIIELYEQDFGKTRLVLHYFLNQKDAIPYLDLLIVQAAFAQKNLSIPVIFRPNQLDRKTKQKLRLMFEDESLIAWAKSRNTNLKQYSGMTNTVLGVYDWIAYEKFAKETGFSAFPKTADAHFDLGGGFATPDISRLIGKEFTSLDLISPREAKKWDLVFQILLKWKLPRMDPSEIRAQRQDERARYFQELENTKWIKYDIFERPLPASYQSYFITSFGFLSSTVGSLSKQIPNKLPSGAFIPGYYKTTYMAIRRVVELVALGKDVDLFSYQRATARIYRYRTVFLSFRNHRLVLVKLWPDENAFAAKNKAAFLSRQPEFDSMRNGGGYRD